MPLEQWFHRQPDHANCFNPGYLALLMQATVKAYEKQAQPMPFSLVFPAATMLLHPGIRSSLPKTVATAWPKWLRDDPQIRVDLGSSMRALVPSIKEGVLTALRSRWIAAAPGGRLTLSTPPTLAKSRIAAEFEQDLSAATFVGKWLARAGTEQDIYIKIGVKP